MFNLNLFSDELQFPHHPKFKNESLVILDAFIKLGLRSHVLLFSSGTTNTHPKGFALSLEALISNAKAVNQHFKLTSSDVWGLSLPSYHVGGLSVMIRSSLLNSRPVDLGIWNPQEWIKKIHDHQVTITTVVPTQVYDLVNQKLRAPSSLKFLIVGGDYLSLELEKRAIQLGWPVIKTFGMTEVCSQLASAQVVGGDLKVLSPHEIKIDASQRLWVKSQCLYTFEFKLIDKVHLAHSKELLDEFGFYPTQDLAQYDQSNLLPLGRLDDQLKISGRLVSFNALKEKLYQYALENNLYGKVELMHFADERSGKKLRVLHLPGITLREDLFAPLTFETMEVSAFERTDLGKLKK